MNDSCKHELLDFDPVPSVATGYQRPKERQRVLAGTFLNSMTNNKRKWAVSKVEDRPSSFPAPLVLPEDDLALDPKQQNQTLHAYVGARNRNEITPDRNVVYVATFPSVHQDVKFVQSWTNPQARDSSGSVPCPRTSDVLDYVAAYYHGLPVREFPTKLSFIAWDENDPGTKAKQPAYIPPYIGLTTDRECVGIRARKAPDCVFKAQLNLDDLLDTAISILPKDAYALALLVEHDLYEDEDDIFVCGRAYGGSRVAVVSTARYNPHLDASQNVDRVHSWPASHCSAYTAAICEASSKIETSNSQSSKRTKVQQTGHKKNTQKQVADSPLQKVTYEDADSPMYAALRAYKVSAPLNSPKSLSGLWLGRVCRTISHELGHCFGIAHCGYYACSMQGSASLAEDARQPPYLCPVDLSKVLYSTGANEEQRYGELLTFCQRHPDVALFSAFGAWIRGRLGDLRPGSASS